MDAPYIQTIPKLIRRYAISIWRIMQTKWMYRVWRFHGGNIDECCLLGYYSTMCLYVTTRRFGGTHGLHMHIGGGSLTLHREVYRRYELGLKSLSILKMEAICPSETSVVTKSHTTSSYPRRQHVGKYYIQGHNAVSPLKVKRRFRGRYSIHLQDRISQAI
jgi:hypothetical protein